MSLNLSGIHPDMPRAEKSIIERLLEDVASAGFAVSVHDGVEVVLKKCTDMKTVFEAMYSTGADTLTFFDQSGAGVGWVWLIWGNGQDVISDYSDNPATGELLKNALIMAEYA
jgi:hypothetical protein